MQEINDKINAPIKGRLRIYLKDKGIAIKGFCARIGVSDSAFRGSGLKSELGGEIIARTLQELPALSPRWLVTGAGSAEEDLRFKDPSNMESNDQSSLAYVIAHGEKSSESANISACSQLEVCLKLLQERDRQLAEKDKQIDQLHKMLQSLISNGRSSTSTI